ncbi:MAG: DUF1579 family protein [Archangiaceae bacterium]|nr:DUF1579 family protein [Archangiaceae bacterium]
MDTRRNENEELRPQRNEAHQALEAFIGQWRLEGKNLDGAEEFAGTDVEGTVTCEWLPGAFFLHQHETVHFFGGGHTTTWITGWDQTRQCYFVELFDDLGFTRRYDLTVEGSTWSFEGALERGSVVFDEDYETYRGFWERSAQGRWIPLCEYTATRLH